MGNAFDWKFKPKSKLCDAVEYLCHSLSFWNSDIYDSLRFVKNGWPMAAGIIDNFNTHGIHASHCQLFDEAKSQYCVWNIEIETMFFFSNSFFSTSLPSFTLRANDDADTAHKKKIASTIFVLGEARGGTQHVWCTRTQTLLMDFKLFISCFASGKKML